TPEDSEDVQKASTRIPDEADIICSNLTFHYPGRLELLQDFSITIPGGRPIALIGHSGCGKSTLAKLLAGLYPLQSGNIRLGMYNMQDLSLDCLRHQVILVPQEAHFWSRSILENFRLGAPHLSLEQIVAACQITGADEFISRLPDKYQTVLGEFGANISGGQRQRLALARAIVQNPPILILDESTAGLDPVSEMQILDRLLTVRQGKTTILISHRPRVITRAEWIVFLDQGQLKAYGSLAELHEVPGEHLEFLVEDSKQVAYVKSEAYYKQGLNHLTLGNNQIAFAAFDSALQHNPDSAKAYYGRGLVRFCLRDNQGAMVDLNAALELNPRYAEVYLGRGLIYRRLGNQGAAIEDIQTAANLFFKQKQSVNYKRARTLLSKLTHDHRHIETF
ncbi:MAG TPA: ATP-binding cassette domain-containing protein, partial [Allocoleopsis sp.]